MLSLVERLHKCEGDFFCLSNVRVSTPPSSRRLHFARRSPSLPLAYNPDWIVIMSDNLKWVLYILECCDGTLYTGISNDVERRLSEHQNGRGAKYTRGRRPVKLVYFEEYVDRSDASKREMEIKRMSRATKLLLADSQTKEI